MPFFPNWAFRSGQGQIPPPPPLPEYDPNIEAPKWNWSKMWYSIDLVKPHPDTPKTGGQPIEEDKPDWRGVIKKNVIPLTPPDKYNFGNYTPSQYYWFDTPDWADPFKKLKFATHFFFKYGLMGTCLYAVGHYYPFDWKTIKYLVTRPFAKVFVGGMTASVAILVIANLRGRKDDHWNYAIAGFLAGSVVGRHNHLSFVRQVLMWTPAAVAVKEINEQNIKIIPMLDYRTKNYSMALGSSAEYGWRSGDWRSKYLQCNGPYDVGRTPRTHTAG